MQSRGKHKIKGKAEIDDTVIGGDEDGVKGKKNDEKKLVIFAIEKTGKGVSRIYVRVIKGSSSKELVGFMEFVFGKDVSIKADKWKGYQPLKKDFINLEQVSSGKKARNFPEMHKTIMNFKSWLRGMHHQVEYLQAYIDEYCYRFNRNFMHESIFDNLLMKIVKFPPLTYNQIIA